MHRIIKYLPIAAFALLFTACNNDLVSRAEYDAMAAYADSLEARCDDLEFELTDQRLYNDYLESLLDSCEPKETIAERNLQYETVLNKPHEM